MTKRSEYYERRRTRERLRRRLALIILGVWGSVALWALVRGLLRG